MGGPVGTPINAVVELRPDVSLSALENALATWLDASHGVELKPVTQEEFVVDWRASAGDSYACQLVTLHSTEQTRRTVTAIRDEFGVVAFVEEVPLSAADSPHAVADITEDTRHLLESLKPLAKTILSLDRNVVNDVDGIEAVELLTALQADLAPGLVVAVVKEGTEALSAPQSELLEAVSGLAIIGRACAESSLFDEAGCSSLVRTGSVVSISRTATGLDAQVIGSNSLRTKQDSARRLLVRRHLAAPIPFNLERRRSTAMTRLLAGGDHVDEQLSIPVDRVFQATSVSVC